MKRTPEICEALRGKLIVSCQASEGEAFRDAESMARFARAAVQAGAAGIRANGVEDIRAIRAAVNVPIIGIAKVLVEDGQVLITPTFQAACELVQAGADMIALDCTLRGQRYGALERIQRFRAELGVPVLADIATVEEAVAAAGAGADLVLSTMRGYTPETEGVRSFEPAFIAKLVRGVDVPVIAEGRIWTPPEARQAIEAGAFAVVIGTAITRPHEITRRFVAALEGASREGRLTIGIDLGATNTKFGLVSAGGELIWQGVRATPARGGRQALLEHLKGIAAECQAEARRLGQAPAALGVATAGWIDPDSGVVVYATENLPGWTGTRIAAELEAATGLPVAVENDANALAVAERHFGGGRGIDNFVVITLGTGVGGGCYIGGRLNHGAHFFANGLGHLQIEPEGLECTCGQRGCLEVYANAAALLRYAAGGGFSTVEEVIGAARSGDAVAREAIRTCARKLATGCALVVHLLDPERLILSGGLAQNNPFLAEDVRQELAARVTVWRERRLEVLLSELGYSGGVLGAAAVAIERGDAA